VAAAAPPQRVAPASAPLPGDPAPPPVASRSDQPLDDAQIAAIIARHKPAFDACIAAGRQSEAPLFADGRRVTVTMTVNPAGRALYPTIDDAEVGAAAVGACLKREAGKMSFPEFAGDAVRVRVPVVLR